MQETSQPQFEWELTGDAARQFVERAHPFMIVKQREGDVLLQCPLHDSDSVPVVVAKDTDGTSWALPQNEQKFIFLSDAVRDLSLDVTAFPGQCAYINVARGINVTTNDEECYRLHTDFPRRVNPPVTVTRIHDPRSLPDPARSPEPFVFPSTAAAGEKIGVAGASISTQLRESYKTEHPGTIIVNASPFAERPRTSWIVKRLDVMDKEVAWAQRDWCRAEIARLKQISHDPVSATFIPSDPYAGGLHDTDGGWGFDEQGDFVYLRPGACQRSRPVVDICCRKFESGTVYGPLITRGTAKSAPGIKFDWRVTSNAHAVEVLRILAPFEVGKREQADLLLKGLESGFAFDSEEWKEVVTKVKALKGLQGKRGRETAQPGPARAPLIIKTVEGFWEALFPRYTATIAVAGGDGEEEAEEDEGDVEDGGEEELEELELEDV